MTDNKAKNIVMDWQSDGDSFGCHICALYMEADYENAKKLRDGWPELCKAADEWFCCGDPDKLFTTWKSIMRGT